MKGPLFAFLFFRQESNILRSRDRVEASDFVYALTLDGWDCPDVSMAFWAHHGTARSHCGKFVTPDLAVIVSEGSYVHHVHAAFTSFHVPVYYDVPVKE